MDISILSSLLDAIKLITWQQIVMLAIGGILVYLAIAHDIEPMLLLPIGFGAIITNLPLNVIFQEHGLLKILYDVGITTEIFPLQKVHGLHPQEPRDACRARESVVRQLQHKRDGLAAEDRLVQHE